MSIMQLPTNANAGAPSSDQGVEAAGLLIRGSEAFTEGHYKESLALLLEAFTFAPSNTDIQAALFEVLSCTTGYTLPRRITNSLADAAISDNRHHNIQALAMVLGNQSKGDAGLQSFTELLETTDPTEIRDEALQAKDGSHLAEVLEDRLFLLVATKAIAISPEIERLLTQLRRHFLFEWTADVASHTYFLDNFTNLLTVIAGQCFNTEYLYEVTEKERDIIAALKATVLKNVRDAHVIDLAMLASYEPLWSILGPCDPEDLDYLMKEAEKWPAWAQLIWKTQFLAPCQEAFLKQSLHALSPVTDPFSSAIGAQYESYPYPRWQTTKLPTKAVSLKEHLETRFPHAELPAVTGAPANILFAGCGTGEQVVQMGLGLNAQNILAVDLSTNSLGYASRKAQEHGMENVHFGQGDILDIKDWDASFDLIVCTGVLHHMRDPAIGLASLMKVSKDSSVFFLALYSERARTAVIASRELVTEHRISDDIAGIQKFRALVRSLPDDHPAKSVTACREFYSASGLHDFIFNTHEIRFSPRAVKALLDAEGLSVIGLDVPRGDYLALYKKQFPDDPGMINLENWETFEEHHTDVFDGMIQLWCCKK